MNVDGLTRENVASHLQKYRLQRKFPTTSNSDGGYSEGHGGHPQPSESAQEQQGGGYGGRPGGRANAGAGGLGGSGAGAMGHEAESRKQQIREATDG